MSPFMNSESNHVFLAEVAAWPEIQWSAAFWIGARSTHEDGTAGTPGSALAGAEPPDAAIAIPGIRPAAAATATATAVTSLYLLTGSLLWWGCSGQIHQTHPEESMKLSAGTNQVGSAGRAARLSATKRVDGAALRERVGGARRRLD